LPSWWSGKVRQALHYVSGTVSDRERAELMSWLTPTQLALFDSMHRVDQRHGLDVVHSLRRAGRNEPELLLAGLFHDAGKGSSTRLHHRVVWSLGEHYGPWIWRAAGVAPGVGAGLQRMREHVERSAQLALDAGCPRLTAELIRHREGAAPGAASLVDALRLADEAN
jgi:hypothetical protein